MQELKTRMTIALAAILVITCAPASARQRAAWPGEGVASLAGLGANQEEECPSLDAFVAAPQRGVELTGLRGDSVWEHVRRVLEEWHREQIDSTSDAPILIVQPTGTPQIAQGVSLSESGRTCFVRHRSERRVDYQIAFLFSGEQTKARGTALTVRWIGFLKGRGERTWQRDRNWSTRQAADLVRRLALPTK